MELKIYQSAQKWNMPPPVIDSFNEYKRCSVYVRDCSINIKLNAKHIGGEILMYLTLIYLNIYTDDVASEMMSRW